MRIVTVLAFAAGLSAAGTARAEALTSMSAPLGDSASSLLLLDAMQATAALSARTLHVPVRGFAGAREEPGEELTQVVERMWSQVRAYRLPGGAELILRGRF